MIEHQMPKKFALEDVLVGYVGNELKDAIWRGNGQLLEMGLKMPSEGDCIWTVFE